MYRTILADPPWEMGLHNGAPRKRSKGGVISKVLPYPTMRLETICEMPVGEMADDDCHLWLWTTNSHLKAGFQVMESWGFKYLVPVHWIKPSGVGNWFIHRTQTLLFGYKKFCRFPLARYRPNILQPAADPKRHSQKPEESYQLIEAVSPPSRLELFARSKREGWDAWGNEVANDVSITTSQSDAGASK